MNKKIMTLLSATLVATTLIACNISQKEEQQSFVGCWKYDGFEYYIILDEDMNWKMIYENGDIDALGEFVLEENVAYLYEQGEYDYEDGKFEEAEEFLQLTFTEDGTLSASNGFTLYATEQPEWSSSYEVKDFVGCWQYDGFDLYLVVEDDMTWTIKMEDGTVKGTGVFTLEEDYVQLYETGGYVYEASDEATKDNMFLRLYLNDSGKMYDSGSRMLTATKEP